MTELQVPSTTPSELPSTTPIAAPLLPRYRAAALCDLLPSSAAAIGARGFSNVLGLPEGNRVCIALIDGLGVAGLRQELASAPTLASFPSQATITAGFPSTTSASLTSLATGLTPAEHGMVGYRMRVPDSNVLLHSLKWDKQIDPVQWQPAAPIFEQLAAQGLVGSYVAASAFQDSGLSKTAWRGAQYVAVETPGDTIAEAASALRQHDRGIAVVYTPDLDRTGHMRGIGSSAWRLQLAVVDEMVRLLLAELPADTVLIVTGDHGMVDVPLEQRVNVDHAAPAALSTRDGATMTATLSREATTALAANIELFSGEDRVRYLHTRAGSADDVLDTWRGILGDRAWIVSRQQAIDEGWYGGPMRSEFSARIGDVIVACTEQLAVVGTHREPRTFLPVGLHGSLTPAEQEIPLWIVQT